MLKIFSETDLLIDVIVPFSMKDEFKAKFKTAKWNAFMKTWSIEKKFKKKFEKFVEIVSKVGISETIKILEAEEFSKSEMEKLEINLNQLELTLEKRIDELRSTERHSVNLSEIKATIADRKIEIERISNHISAVKDENISVQKEILMRLQGIFDLGEVMKQKRELEKWHSIKTSASHSKFNDAQSIIIEIRSQLRDAGFDSAALKALASANYNRLDRDSTSHITEEMILTFEAL